MEKLKYGYTPAEYKKFKFNAWLYLFKKFKFNISNLSNYQ